MLWVWGIARPIVIWEREREPHQQPRRRIICWLERVESWRSNWYFHGLNSMKPSHLHSKHTHSIVPQSILILKHVSRLYASHFHTRKYNQRLTQYIYMQKILLTNLIFSLDTIVFENFWETKLVNWVEIGDSFYETETMDKIILRQKSNFVDIYSVWQSRFSSPVL